jgi:prolyl oligopeptidase
MRRTSLAFTLSLTVLGCTSSSTPPAEYPAMAEADSTQTGTVLVSSSPLEDLNRRAREGAVTDTIHGVSVEDPYRALEEDSALTHEWIDVNTARTAAAVTSWSRAATSRRLDELLRIGSVSGAALGGAHVFYLLREGEREQPALMMRGFGATDEARVLVDPTTYGEHAALDWYFVSPTGRYVAFGISTNGDERSTLRVLETATGTLRPDTIEHTKWTDLTWLHDETAFYYRRYPRAGEPDYDAEHEDSYHTRLFFHALGTDPTSDPLVFSPTDRTFFPGTTISDDDRWLVVTDSAGWTRTDVMLFDRGARGHRTNVPDATHPLLPVVVEQDHLYTARVHHGQLYLLTNEDAPRYRLMRVSPSAAANDRSTWQVVIPEGSAAIQDWTIAGDRHVLHVLDDVHSRLFVHQLSGALDHEMTLPGPGAVAGIDGDVESGRLAVGFSGYVNAPELLLWDPHARAPRAARGQAPAAELRPLVAIASPVDLSTLEVVQEHVPSTDGASIPLYYIQRRGTPHDGTAPVLLNAYGGFNISLLPSFARHPLYWVERGGIFAVANLRGGGEFGEDWHRAGNLANKHHVFEDMEAVIRWFSTSGISRPDRIGITGGSNGGLLMGAMITRCPDAFGAAASYVGLYDMVRYHQFPPAELWVTEYGSSEDADQFRFLYDYSPYHHVTAASAHPAILIETADHDTRVFWGHSTKFAARLQEAAGGADPHVWFYREQQVGHGAGTPVTALVARYTRMYAFLEHALGVADALTSTP